MHSKYRSNSISLSEQEELFRVITDVQDLALFKLALRSGIRREDIASIQLKDVDFEKHEVTFWESKKKRFWTVPMIDDVERYMKMYISTISKGQKELFTFTGRTAYNHLQHYLKKAGINKRISFHDLRRSFIKSGKRLGIPPKMMSQITGDKISTIERYYENYNTDEMREELNKKFGGTNGHMDGKD